MRAAGGGCDTGLSALTACDGRGGVYAGESLEDANKVHMKAQERLKKENEADGNAIRKHIVQQAAELKADSLAIKGELETVIQGTVADQKFVNETSDMNMYCSHDTSARPCFCD